MLRLADTPDSCRLGAHQDPFIVRTGQLAHAFCGVCGRWYGVELHVQLAPEPEGTDEVLEALGERRTLYEWWEETGLTVPILRARIKRGWTPEQVVTVPEGEMAEPGERGGVRPGQGRYAGLHAASFRRARSRR